MEIAIEDEGRTQNGKEDADNIESSTEIELRSGKDIVTKASGDDGNEDCIQGSNSGVDYLPENEAVVENDHSTNGDHTVTGENGTADASTSGGPMLPVVEALFRREADRSESDHKDAESKGRKDSVVSDWSNWKPRGNGDKSSSNDHRKVEDLWSSPQGGMGEEWEWDWRHYVLIKDSTVRVELSGCAVKDSDLPSLLRHLHPVMQKQQDKTRKEHAVLNVDLSCNEHISDRGVTDHLVPFLHQWPACSRLKLYKTSIGDKAIESLGSWISQGHAREIHLSDLHRQVTRNVVKNFLKQVHDCGCYPYYSDDGNQKGYGSLWLRLEHNGIRNPETLVKELKKEGASIAVIEKEWLGRVSRGVCASRKRDLPAVNLALFHEQDLKEPRKKGNADVEHYIGEADYSDWNGTNGDWHAYGSSHPTSRRDRNNSGHSHDWQDAPKNEKKKAWSEDNSWHEQQSAINEHRMAQLTAAHELLKAIDGRVLDADPEVEHRWHQHLQYSMDPVFEATRIAKMVGGLCSLGYNGSWAGSMTSPSLKPSHHPTGLSVAPFDIGAPEPASSSSMLGAIEPSSSSTVKNAEDSALAKQRPLVSDLTSRLQANSPPAPASSSTPSGDDSAQKREKKGKNKMNKISCPGPPDTSALSEAPPTSVLVESVASTEEPDPLSIKDDAEEPISRPSTENAEDCVESTKEASEDLSVAHLHEGSETTCEQ